MARLYEWKSMESWVLNLHHGTE
uniref:Uncharacterized protein n=1 Tax=Anguilla anguilla TaxID=7936 RepID=A0A0E9XI79_ANGAN